MKQENYAAILEFLHRESGLVLGQDKQYLLDARLLPIAEQAGLADLDALAQKLKAGGDARINSLVVDAMTTNETYFFRDTHVFTMLFTELLPRIMEERKSEKKLRIWSAACSTGQEPYSIMMGIERDLPQLAGWKIELVATDLSPTVLEKAKNGLYNHFEVQRGLPAPLLVKHFEQVDRHFQAKPELRSKIDFRPLNLKASYATLGTFDLILCRNVLIYFDVETKGDILTRLSRQLSPEGYLLLGASETTVGLDTPLQKQKLAQAMVFRPQSAVVPQ